MFYSIECRRWSIRLRRFAIFRLTFRHVWIAERATWADYLVRAEELD